MIVGRHVCFTAFERLYLGGGLGESTYKGIEGLWVTVGGNESLTNKKGGVQELQCRWGSRGTGSPAGCTTLTNPRGVSTVTTPKATASSETGSTTPLTGP